MKLKYSELDSVEERQQYVENYWAGVGGTEHVAYLPPNSEPDLDLQRLL